MQLADPLMAIRILLQAFKNMAWGAASGASQWAGKLRANDDKLNSLFVMPFRKMAEKDWIELCDSLGEFQPSVAE